jgi:hypothetical protein
LTNIWEFRLGEDPRLVDTDHDGVPDGGEDKDHDGLGNRIELVLKLSPTRSDTDGDRTPDDDEDTDGDHLTNVEKGQVVRIRISSSRTYAGVSAVGSTGRRVSTFASR